MRKVLNGAVLAALLCASGAHARDFYYFYKPSTTRDAYVADRSECDRLAGGVDRSAKPQTIYVAQSNRLSPGANAAAVAIASLFAGLMAGDPSKQVVRAVERTCMADKGYARFKVDKTLVQSIDRLPTPDERVERYFALATAPAPTGERIKE